MDYGVSAYLEEVAARARRARNVFVLAIVVCALLALNVTVLRARSAATLERLHFSLGPILLWSLTAAAHGFHLLAQANSRLTRKVGDILSADQARAQQRLKAIKARLGWPERGGKA